MIANSIMAYMAMFRNGQDRSLQSKTLGPALTPNSYFLTPNLPFLRYYGQHRTIPALRLKHRSGSCGTASALPKCSIMSGCGTRIVLRFAVSATGGAHLCSIQYYLRFWLSSCRTSLAVLALRIMRCCLKNCGKSGLKYRILSPAAPVLHRRAAGILFCAKNPGNSGQPLA